MFKIKRQKSLILISSVIFILLLIFFLLYSLLKERKYYFYCNSSIYELLQEKNPEIPSENFLITKNKNISIYVINADYKNSIQKLKKAIYLGEIKKFLTSYEKQDSVYNIEIERRLFYPCVPFSNEFTHDVLDLNDENIQIPIDKEKYNCFMKNAIPNGNIAVPVKYHNNIIYADSEDYPLQEVYYASFDFIEKAFTKKIDIKAFELAKQSLPSYFQKIKNETPPPEIFYTSAVGDMMFGRGVQDLMYSKTTLSEGVSAVFTDTLPILQNNDFTIGNLECVVTERNLKTPKTYNFKVRKKVLPYVKEAGFDYLMMTNNHSYDYGEEGFKDTLQAVKENNFATSGVGFNKTEASEFYRTTIKNHKISVLSCAAFPVEHSGFDGEKSATATDKRAGLLWKNDAIVEKVKKEKADGAIVIINCHAGAEYVTKPNKTQDTFYKQLCDAGADVIFGSHPHVLQPVEMYNGSLIVWSLGNYIFPGMEEMKGATDTMIIRTGFDKGKLVYYEKYPCKIDGTKVKRAE